jgi:hypothetical protein
MTPRSAALIPPDGGDQALSAPPGGQAATDQSAAMPPQRLWCQRNPVLSGQLGCSLGGGGGTQGFGKGLVLLEQLLELVQGCNRGILCFGCLPLCIPLK